MAGNDDSGRLMDTVNPDRNVEMQARLLSAARALDDDTPMEALSWLRKLPLATGDEAARLVALALWKRMVLLSDGGAPLAAKDAKAALGALTDLGSALTDAESIWAGYRAFPVLEEQIGSGDAAAAVAGLLWDRILAAHEGVFVAAFELFFRGGDLTRCRLAWQQFLAVRTDYIPGYWLFLLYCKTRPHGDGGDATTEVKRMLAAADRGDLAPLMAIYLMQMRQEDCERICEEARQLAVPAHRLRVADYMTGLGYMPEDLPIAVATFRELARDGEQSDTALSFMEARLANADRRWDDVIARSGEAAQSAQFRYPAKLLTANALGQLRQADAARKEITEVAHAADAADYLRARAAFVQVNVELVEKGLRTPENTGLPAFITTSGRPLAQSLWVGKRLRWIEQLAIKSYLDNGWRFQLYAYDDIENVPDGCEVLDANAIIPSKDVFKEGFGSGLHAGSLGAFSDLFRYKMLFERGGMWTDTDVINLKRFDPDGMRFISTEISDAGLITLNGAILAAPAGNAFVARAYDRASELLRSKDMFFTRIGPYLLAELLIESGVDSMALMPPNFLSAVFWMNTADLLDPYEDFVARMEKQEAVNLHIYTEMWRMLGLGLDRPPGRDTFLGRLYAERFGQEDTRA